MNDSNETLSNLNLELDALDMPVIEELEISDSLSMPEAGASSGVYYCCSCCCCS